MLKQMLNQYVNYILHIYESSKNFDSDNLHYFRLKQFLKNGYLVHHNEHLKKMDISIQVGLLSGTSGLEFVHLEEYEYKLLFKLL